MKSNSNWSRLKPKVEKDKKGQGSLDRNKNRAFSDNSKTQAIVVNHEDTKEHSKNMSEGYIPECVQLVERVHEKLQSNYVGLDCEMVGIGLKGKQSALARCCLVDFNGNKVYDEFVRPPGFVTDFRTKWSGIRRQDLRHGLAVSLSDCQIAVAKLLKGKVLVGHALKNDMSVLMLSHPRRMIRDTATYRPLMRSHGTSGKYRPRSLRDLSKEHLSITIQTGEHDPGEDARSAMMLYRLHRKTWESSLRTAKNAAMNKASTNNSSSITTSSSSSKSSIEEEPCQQDNSDDDDDDDDDDNSNFVDQTGEALNQSATAKVPSDPKLVDNETDHKMLSKKRQFPNEPLNDETKINASIDQTESITSMNKKIKLQQNQHTDRKQYKKNGTIMNGSSSGMFASCSIDSKGRSLPSISSVSTTKSLKSPSNLSQYKKPNHFVKSNK